jgi:hypothetical protein
MSRIRDTYSVISRQEWERKTRKWEYAFCVLPHRCIESGRIIWLKGAYRGHKIRRYDMQVFDTYAWMSSEEFIKLRLTEKL